MIKAILYLMIFPFTIWAMEGLDLNKLPNNVGIITHLFIKVKILVIHSFI